MTKNSEYALFFLEKTRKALTDLALDFFFSVQIRECPPTPIPRENDDYSTFCH